MHILFLTDNFPPEGNAIASRVFERACYWVKWGHQVTVITSAPNFPEGKVYAGYKNKWYQVEMMQGIKVVRVKTFIAKNKGFSLRILDFLSYIFPALFASLWQPKPDLVVATTPQFFVGLTAWCVALIRAKPFILEVADIWPASIVSVGAMQMNVVIRCLEKLELFLYRRAKAIVVLTAAFKRNLVSRGISADKITTVINGVELSKYQPRARNDALAKVHGIPNDAFVMGYLGTHGMAHALLNVLHTAQLLPADLPVFFLFVGAGAERETLMRYAHENNIKNVLFIPAQPKEKMPCFWSLCDLALIHLKNDPVFAEVIPSKIFEAMGMGLPILLAAPKGEASEIVTTQKVGVWVPAEDPEALAQAIQTLYAKPQLRSQFAKTSQQSAALYSRERQAKKMLITIADTLGMPSFIPQGETKI